MIDAHKGNGYIDIRGAITMSRTQGNLYTADISFCILPSGVVLSLPAIDFLSVMIHVWYTDSEVKPIKTYIISPSGNAQIRKPANHSIITAIYMGCDNFGKI